MTDAIAWALVHFLWQGTALAVVAALLMRLATSASVRYLIGVSTLTAMVVAVGLTIALTSQPPHVVQGSTGSTVHGSFAPPVQESGGPGSLPAVALTKADPRVQVLPTTWIFTMWMLGVLALSVRSLGGWWVARRVARDAVTPLSDELQAVARALAERLAIRGAVGVFQSSRVAVPVMIGWLRPVVLMPPAALSGLSIAQVEAILAHEFAHIRRHDYFVNLLQAAIETMLFFHPAVWWVSREVRRERELCCDDLAVSVSDRLTYATALSALAHLHAPSPALAATDGSLRDRVRRIITNSSSPESARGGWMALLPLLLVVSLVSPSAFTQTADLRSAPMATSVEPRPSAQREATPVGETAPNVAIQLKTPRVETGPDRIAFVAPPALPVVSNYFILRTHVMALQPPPPQATQPRRIAAGDIVRLAWTGIDSSDSDINGRYVVATDGTIAVKYIGFLPVAGKTTAEIEPLLVDAMSARSIYPRGVLSVSADISQDDRRNIIIVGLVVRPGEHRLFPEQMTVRLAIAAVGGLLPSAGDIEIRRRGVDQPINITRTQFQAGMDLAVLDDDFVTVRQRHVFFVVGHVKMPGQKAWEPGMTVEKALGLSGGIMPKGKLGHIRRPIKNEKGTILEYAKIKALKLETEILPDDQLVIEARWWGE